MTGRMRQLLVIGEALIDVVRRTDDSVDEAPGGSPANVALALGRLGRAPRLVTALGADERGAAVRAWLESSGVEVVAAPIGRTATATAVLDRTGSATYEFDLEWALRGLPVGAAGVVHTGSIAALREPGAADVRRALEELRETALITYDPNIRPALLTDPATVRPQVEAVVRLADVVKASDEDLRWLYPDESPGAVARAWQASGPAIVVVTAGPAGATAVTDAGSVAVAAVPTDVVDTVGAGDTFMGALVDGLLEAGFTGASARGDLHRIGHDDLEAILGASARAAAITVSRPGADPPARAELFPHPPVRRVRAVSTKG